MAKKELTPPEAEIPQTAQPETPKETPLPPSGGSWRQDPETGELVKAITNDELRITNEQQQAVEPDKENQ